MDSLYNKMKYRKIELIMLRLNYMLEREMGTKSMVNRRER